MCCACEGIWLYICYTSHTTTCNWLKNDFFSFLRETREECGLAVAGLDKVGIILFEFLGQSQMLEVHVFRTENYTGSPVETEGAITNSLCNFDSIPFSLCTLLTRNETAVVRVFRHSFPEHVA